MGLRKSVFWHTVQNNSFLKQRFRIYYGKYLFINCCPEIDSCDYCDQTCYVYVELSKTILSMNLLNNCFFYLIMIPNYTGSTVDGSSIFNEYWKWI